jgi:hypothetical protein
VTSSRPGPGSAALLKLLWLTLLAWALAVVCGCDSAKEDRDRISATSERFGVPTMSRRACTLHVAPHGSSSATGRSPSRPTTLTTAGDRAVPGSVICLRPGRYGVRREIYFDRSGRAGRPIVYRSRGRTALLRWTGGRAEVVGTAIFKVGNDVHHLRFEHLRFDGANQTTQCIKVNRGGHHVAIAHSRFANCAGSAIATKRADYITVARNMIHHTGYNRAHGWGSGISLNSHLWSDRAPGFHSYVVGNVISGATDESSYNSDGSGVIIDLGGDAPPVLVAGNVAYHNGDHCINVLDVAHVWVVNNTCYQNGLDRRQTQTAEITVHRSGAADVHVINNVAYAAAGRPPYRLGDGASAAYAGNLQHGGRPSELPESVLADPFQVRTGLPLFVDPPAVDRNAQLPQAGALPPSALGTGLTPRPASPLIDAGIDPHDARGLTPALRAGIQSGLRRDARGVTRPQGRAWDVGAYEVADSAPRR